MTIRRLVAVAAIATSVPMLAAMTSAAHAAVQPPVKVTVSTTPGPAVGVSAFNQPVVGAGVSSAGVCAGVGYGVPFCVPVQLAR